MLFVTHQCSDWQRSHQIYIHSSIHGIGVCLRVLGCFHNNWYDSAPIPPTESTHQTCMPHQPALEWYHFQPSKGVMTQNTTISDGMRKVDEDGRRCWGIILEMLDVVLEQRPTLTINSCLHILKWVTKPTLCTLHKAYPWRPFYASRYRRFIVYRINTRTPESLGISPRCIP